MLESFGGGVAVKLFPPFSLDVVNECLWRSGEAGADERIQLTPKSFEVLRYLVEHPGRVVTHRELLDSVWPGTFIEPQAVKKQIFDLRRALDDPPRTPRFIETLPRRGYRFIAPVGEGTVRTPTLPPASPGSDLVGRDRELAELDQCLLKAVAGQRQVVFLTGEPGIGKTALSDEFQRQALARDPSIRIARGQCVEGFGSKEPFAPVLEALGHLCRGDGGAAVLKILAERAPTWLVHFTALLNEEYHERLQREVLGATRERSLRELIDALETVAAATPLVLVLEDIHWVDYSTLDVISGLGRRRSTAKLMLIATYRPADVALSQHPLPMLKADLVARGCGREIAMHPLSEPEIARYLSADSAGLQASNLAALIHRHSDGNPLFMIAVLEYMNARGLIQRSNGSWQLLRPPATADLKVPESLRQMIESQVQSLGTEDQRVLEVASIAGITFTPFISAATANLDPAQFDQRCDALARRNHLVRGADTQALPDGTLAQRYEFLHALYREVLYERQAPAHRAALHRRLADRLEALFGNQLSDLAQELAHHFEAGGDWPGAVIYLRLAADVAARRYAPREATANLQRALEFAGKLPLTARATAETEILDRLAGMYHMAFDDVRAMETSEALLARAVQYGLVDVEIRALIGMAYPLGCSSTDRCREVLDRALLLSSAQQDPLARARTRASCLVRRIWAGGWNDQDANECRAALTEIRRDGDRVVVASHMMDCTFLEWSSSHYREARRQAVESLATLMEGCEVHRYLSFPYWLGAFTVPRTLLFLGEWGEALKEIATGIAMAEKNGDHYRGQTLQLYGALVRLFGMDYVGARDICASVLPVLGEPARTPWRRWALAIAGAAEVGLGEHERALGHLMAAKQEMDDHTVINDWYCRMMLQAALTDLWLAQGDLPRAVEEGQTFLAVACATAERTWQALAWEANARIALARLDVDRAGKCITEALSAMEGFEVPLAAWRVHATAAELSDLQGNFEASDWHHRLSRATIEQLAQSLAEEEPLRETFLESVGKAVKPALSAAKGR